MSHIHRRVELRSIALHQVVVERMRDNSEILDKARARVHLWLVDGGPTHPVYARRWQELLAQPLPEILEILVADTEWMRDLRQTTPFAGVLTDEERWEIIRHIR